MAVKDIDTIVYVMLENRSFDQMLGYLSLDETARGLPVDGLRSDTKWQWPWANLARGAEYPIRRIPQSQPIHEDPPHGREAIGLQIDTSPRGPGPDRMGGFVETYMRAHRHPADPGVVMGHYIAEDVPTYDFLARNFCVCDRWFAPLPLGTQANRLMAMSGASRVVDNVTGLPDQPLVYDWLEERGVPWRVYVSGGFTPFFIMMRRWALRIVGSLALGKGTVSPFFRLPPRLAVLRAYAIGYLHRARIRRCADVGPKRRPPTSPNLEGSGLRPSNIRDRDEQPSALAADAYDRDLRRARRFFRPRAAAGSRDQDR